MENHQRSNQKKSDFEEDIISIADLLPILWHSRRMVLTSTIIAGVVGASAALLLSQYKSEGFLQFGGPIPIKNETDQKKPEPERSNGISLSDYKRYAAAFNSSGRLSEFVQQKKLESMVGINGLRSVFSSREGGGRLIEPIYPFTKLDAKELLEDPKDGNNNVIGLRISYAAGKPEDAQQMVRLLGQYTMDTILYVTYSDALRFKHSEMTAKITKLDNDIIESKEKLLLYQRQGQSLKNIVSRYPDSSSQAARQVISVTEENARYLSPSVQLMTSEVQTAETNEDIYKSKREQKQYLLLREYYDQVKTLLDGTKSGETILRGMEGIKAEVFKNKDMSDEVIKEVYNTITIDNQNAQNLYLEKSRFIAGPSLPEHRSGRPVLTLMLSLLFGLLSSSFFAILRSWWKGNNVKTSN
ncbi:hypothetical protein [Janthinobacterium agaricidamnosum]|uniref:Lipopolysaccharide biosynthesis protein n=1 Tax=Janthinobacterium agaricidamnosum NBRC 102515 = DSM 9628 TaxID=1349767 RepID=W0V1U3_9BURK|nr:hypothetical protein [Janthinobacterium agaricidamnosum]CDG81580.1 hypothetical protein GJA_924 [Janthinobacterium agaricidamnosum NBRC 102515 = DSM 9628]